MMACRPFKRPLQAYTNKGWDRGHGLELEAWRVKWKAEEVLRKQHRGFGWRCSLSFDNFWSMICYWRLWWNIWQSALDSSMHMILLISKLFGLHLFPSKTRWNMKRHGAKLYWSDEQEVWTNVTISHSCYVKLGHTQTILWVAGQPSNRQTQQCLVRIDNSEIPQEFYVNNAFFDAKPRETVERKVPAKRYTVRPDVLTRVMQRLYRFHTITVESRVS